MESGGVTNPLSSAADNSLVGSLDDGVQDTAQDQKDLPLRKGLPVEIGNVLFSCFIGHVVVYSYGR